MPPPPPTSAEEPRGAERGSAGGEVLPLVPGFERRPARRRPLPDAAAVRLLPVPDSAPPYDDALPEIGRRRRPLPPSQPEPALLPKPAAPATARPAPTPDTEPSSPPPSRSATLPRPATAPRKPAADARWPSQFAQVLAETLAGSRPQGQIRPWTTDQARRRIRQLGPNLAAGVQPRVRRVMTSRPATGVVEMTVIVGFGPKIRALAVRLEHRGPEPDAAAARWICTAIEAA
jgi:hypothetical protein